MPFTDKLRNLISRRPPGERPPIPPKPTHLRSNPRKPCPSQTSNPSKSWTTADPKQIMGYQRTRANSYKTNSNLMDQSLLGANTAVPTNAWWQNLIIEAGDQPVVTSPYMVKCLADSIVLCAPSPLVQKGFVASVWHDDWRIKIPGSRKVVSYDKMSVTVAYADARVPLSKGSPFVTVLFENDATFDLSTIHAVVNVQACSNAPGAALVTLNDGRTWLVACETPAVLAKSGMSAIVADRPVRGAVRIALIPETANKDAGALLAARDAIVIGGDVTVDVSDNTAVFAIDWKVRGSGAPLVCALPHHQLLLASAAWEDGAGKYWTSKGTMRVVSGVRWELHVALEPLGFTAARPLPSNHATVLRGLVKSDAHALPEDINMLPEDPYFFGKALARAARIALISDEVGETQSRDLALDRMVAWLEPWLSGSNPNPLVYDTEWRGLVSTKGIDDAGADFGQGRYNDHHFHYGYFVYASAVLSKLRPKWATPRMPQLDLFVRDYAGPVETYFAPMRNFDFFDGHSWAAGLFAFADSRNQESTSEAINAYYSAYLYAQATGRESIARYMHAIVQLEAFSARVYWHISDLARDVYPNEFAAGKATIGILWSSKCDFATFFGANPEFIYGIQFLPYTPATALLIKREWLEQVWSGCLKNAADQAQAEPWKEILDLAVAPLDRDLAFSRIAQITNHDDGNSASNSYYWVATAP